MAGVGFGLGGGDIGEGLLSAGLRPSYFEVAAADSLLDGLRPALQFLMAASLPSRPSLSLRSACSPPQGNPKP